MPGTVLIEGHDAVVEVQASQTSWMSELLNHASLWFKRVKTTACAVCVKA
jgi:hypothetical protein